MDPKRSRKRSRERGNLIVRLCEIVAKFFTLNVKAFLRLRLSFSSAGGKIMNRRKLSRKRTLREVFKERRQRGRGKGKQKESRGERLKRKRRSSATSVVERRLKRTEKRSAMQSGRGGEGRRGMSKRGIGTYRYSSRYRVDRTRPALLIHNYA